MAISILPVLAGKAHTTEAVKQALSLVSGAYPELADVVRAAQRTIATLEDHRRDVLLAVTVAGDDCQRLARDEYLKRFLAASITVSC